MYSQPLCSDGMSGWMSDGNTAAKASSRKMTGWVNSPMRGVRYRAKTAKKTPETIRARKVRNSNMLAIGMRPAAIHRSTR